MNEQELREYEKRLDEKEKAIKELQNDLDREREKYLVMAMEREKKLQEEIKELEMKGMSIEGKDAVDAMIRYQRHAIQIQGIMISRFRKTYPDEFNAVVKDLGFDNEDIEKINILIQMLKDRKASGE
jgi:hypothetical protein